MKAFLTKPSANDPPIAAQVLYALGFVALMFALFTAVIAISTTSNDVSETYSFLGAHMEGFKFFAMIVVMIGIGLFVVINNIRAGKLWALITYTVIFTLSAIREILIGGIGNIASIIPLVFVGCLLGSLWLRHRSYFR